MSEFEHYKVEDDQSAEWCLTQIRNAQKEKQKWKEFYDDRYRKVCEACDMTIANMESLLQTYFESVPHKVTPTQENYTLPSGKLVFKRQEAEFEKDEDQVIGWLKENNGGAYIKTKETLDWGNLKKTLTVTGETVSDENGEIIPGIKAIERPDIFKVELRKEEV